MCGHKAVWPATREKTDDNYDLRYIYIYNHGNLSYFTSKRNNEDSWEEPFYHQKTKESKINEKNEKGAKSHV